MDKILRGYGKPSVLLPGWKGQIYIDQLTGDEYECKGERGFIRVDGDDQDNQFNWILKKKEKPFYENVLTSVPRPNDKNAFWYKVSDNIPTGDVSDGTECTAFLDGVGHYGYIYVIEPYCYVASECIVVVILKDNATVPDLDNTVFPTKGTYFLSDPDQVHTITGFSIGKTDVPEITWDGQTTKLKKLDEKFIPSRIIGIINSDLTFTADPSFDPSTMSVFDALASGKDLLFKMNAHTNTMKCVSWYESADAVSNIGFYDPLNDTKYQLKWEVLSDGTVSITSNTPR